MIGRKLCRPVKYVETTGGGAFDEEDWLTVFCFDVPDVPRYRLRASNHTNLTEESILTYLRAIDCPCLLVRGATGMLKDIPANLNRMAAMGDRLQDLVLPGSHHLHASSCLFPCRRDFGILGFAAFFFFFSKASLPELACDSSRGASNR